jgi:hypothetical protein
MTMVLVIAIIIIKISVRLTSRFHCLVNKKSKKFRRNYVELYVGSVLQMRSGMKYSK